MSESGHSVLESRLVNIIESRLETGSFEELPHFREAWKEAHRPYVPVNMAEFPCKLAGDIVHVLEDEGIIEEAG